MFIRLVIEPNEMDKEVPSSYTGFKQRKAHEFGNEAVDDEMVLHMEAWEL